MLSHPIPIFALVGRYPTNKLIGHRPLLRRIHTFGSETSSGITGSFPPLSQSQGYVPMYYSPFRRCPSIATLIARLACLIHAANVHSEPGSNPSIVYCLSPCLRWSPAFRRSPSSSKEFISQSTEFELLATSGPKTLGSKLKFPQSHADCKTQIS